MKEQLIKITAIVAVIIIYGSMFWLTINPVLEYFEAKEVDFIQSLSMVTLIMISILFIKEL